MEAPLPHDQPLRNPEYHKRAATLLQSCNISSLACVGTDVSIVCPKTSGMDSTLRLQRSSEALGARVQNLGTWAFGLVGALAWRVQEPLGAVL